MTKPEMEHRLERAEAAISALAYFEGRLAAIPRGRCLELDEIRDQYAGRIKAAPEQRPFSAPERREEVAA
jgi:hypothetical protein